MSSVSKSSRVREHIMRLRSQSKNKYPSASCWRVPAETLCKFAPRFWDTMSDLTQDHCLKPKFGIHWFIRNFVSFSYFLFHEINKGDATVLHAFRKCNKKRRPPCSSDDSTATEPESTSRSALRRKQVWVPAGSGCVLPSHWWDTKATNMPVEVRNAQGQKRTCEGEAHISRRHMIQKHGIINKVYLPIYLPSLFPILRSVFSSMSCHSTKMT